jgi:CheY-like chemotaxis protein
VRDVFLVEDEALIRMMIADVVVELGHRVVAEAGSTEAAEPFAQSAQFDFAILDINLAGRNVFPAAQMIDKRSLLFASGYGTTGLPEPFRKRTVLNKPFLITQLSLAIDALFAPIIME